MTTHQIPIRIYYEDTDAGGVVYHANYLRFAERGRTEWLRHKGFSNSSLMAECGILIVVKAIEIDYKKPARLDDSLILHTHVLEIGGTSLKMSQILRKDDVDVCDMTVIVVCVDAGTGRPTRWPENLRTVLQDHAKKVEP